MPYPVSAARGHWTGAAIWSPADWWTVAGQTCVAAYQPKGAPSLAASYTNVANPGTYDAAPGTAPAFDTTTGWTFDGATSSCYLTTGIVPAETWSAIVRLPTHAKANTWVLGQFTTNGWGIKPWDGSSETGYYSGGSGVSVAGGRTSGVWAMADRSGYYNSGTAVATISAGTLDSPLAIYIGARNHATRMYYSGTIAALAIYSTTLSGADVSALITRMNAL